MNKVMERAANTLFQVTPAQQKARPAGSVLAQAAWKYSFAVLVVVSLAAIFHPLRAEIYITPIMLAAVVISAWYGGFGPGVLSVIVSTASIYYYFQLQRPLPRPPINEIPRLIQFAAIGLVFNYLIAARKRA